MTALGAVQTLLSRNPVQTPRGTAHTAAASRLDPRRLDDRHRCAARYTTPPPRTRTRRSPLRVNVLEPVASKPPSPQIVNQDSLIEEQFKLPRFAAAIAGLSIKTVLLFCSAES